MGDRISLGIFIQYQLSTVLQKGETESAELAALMIGKSDRTIRDWIAQFLENDCKVPDSKQGHYQRSGVLWQNEDLNKKASKYIRENAAVKGRPNLTACSFCEWVNEELLVNETLEPGFPRKISVETARHWLHELGFEVLGAKKGCYVDGHERDDVVEDRRKFLCRMVALGFLNSDNAPTEGAKSALPGNLHCPEKAIVDKTVMLFHD